MKGEVEGAVNGKEFLGVDSGGGNVSMGVLSLEVVQGFADLEFVPDAVFRGMLLVPLVAAAASNAIGRLIVVLVWAPLVVGRIVVVVALASFSDTVG